MIPRRWREAGRRLARRWVHLLLGGALLMPYFLLVTVVLSLTVPGIDVFTGLGPQFAVYALCLPLVAGTALLFPLVRPLESAAAGALCSVPQSSMVSEPAGSWAARRRTAGWFTLHAGVGALVSGASLALPPAAAVLVLYPFVESLREVEWLWPDGPAAWTALPAGLALAAALVAAVHAAGALLDRCAPVLLGPTPADRLALAERRAADLAVRNRLARELHDSVGHALSAVTLQAGAARRVLGTDPDFTREALAAIEETARSAVAELDGVLGVLREDDEPDGPAAEDGSPGRAREPRPPTLASGLQGLLQRMRAAGVRVGGTFPDEEGAVLAALPDQLSREAYRIVQEGLTNVLRHAGRVPVDLSIKVQATGRGEELVVRVENPLPGPRDADASHGRGRRRGGRGLRGMEERAALLGGSVESAPHEGSWRMTARLPLRSGGPGRPGHVEQAEGTL